MHCLIPNIATNTRRTMVMLFILLASLLLSARTVFAQISTEHILFRNLSIDEGLTDPEVNVLFQDSRGFIWLGTDNGLNRYDGNRFEHFQHDPEDASSIGANSVHSLVEDQDGYIWISFEEFGMDRFDPRTKRFTHFRADEQDANAIPTDYIDTLFIGENGSLWLGTDEQGLIRYDIASGIFHEYAYGDEPDSIGGDHVKSIEEDAAGNLWLGLKDNGFSRLNPTTGEIVHYPNDDGRLSNIQSILADSLGNIWLASDDEGLIRFNPETEKFIYYVADDASSIVSNSVDGLAEDSQQRIWIGQADGLSFFDLRSEQFTHFFHDPLDFNSLSNNNIESIMVDRTGMLWFGTSAGASILNPQHLNYQYYFDLPNQDNDLLGNFVQAIFVDENGVVWIGTDEGLNRYDPASGKFIYYAKDEGEPAGFPLESVFFITGDRNGTLWLGAEEGAISRFDIASETAVLFESDEDDPTTLGDDDIRSMYLDEHGILWISTEDEQLNRFDTNSNSFTHLRHDENDPTSIPDESLRDIISAGDGKLWFGMEDGGVALFDTQQLTTTHFDYDEWLHEFYQGKDAETLYVDEHGILWIGADDAGLLRFEPENGRLTQYNEQAGLINNRITGILPDQDGNLWLATKAGLARFNPVTERFSNFGLRDGIVGLEFLENAYTYDAANSLLYFGFAGGLVAFNATDIDENSHAPPVIVTGFQLFDEDVGIDDAGKLTQSIEYVESVTLAHDESVFTFEFSALDYVRPEKNRYAYFLEGFDKDWILADDNQRFVTYTSIPAGTYTFHVKATNSDGVWNETGSAIVVTIMPPWWQLRWVQALFALAFLAAFIAYARWRTYDVAARNVLLEKEVAQRTEELTVANQQLLVAKTNAEQAREKAEVANHAKSTFLSSMSHELRTPLNGILGYTQILKRDQSLKPRHYQGLDIIQQSGSHLLTLINDILDISKIEARKLDLHPVDIEIPAFLKVVVDIIRTRADEKALLFTCNQAENLPTGVKVDEKRLRQILINLLGNAVKFTSVGEVNLTVFRIQQPTSTEGIARLQFAVSDTGVGMTPEELAKIFEPFEQVGERDKQAEGTGLGLAICKQLVEAMGGQLQVESQLGQGSRFWFELDLPISQEIVHQTIDVSPLIVGYSGPRRKILIVDDKVHNRSVLTNLLRPLGFETVDAKDGREAIDLTIANRPDLLLMDMVMPTMTGMEAVQALRSMDATKHVPIIAVSASVFGDDQDSSLIAGCDEFLPKPVDADALFEILARYLAIDWRYSDVPNLNMLQQDATALTHLPPKDVLERLYGMALQGDLHQLEQAATKLIAEDKWKAFAHQILQWAQEFEEQKIIAHIEKSISHE